MPPWSQCMGLGLIPGRGTRSHTPHPSIRVFCSESALRIRWPKYWSFSFNIRPSNEHPGLISFRMDWLDVLAVHGTLKSLLQHHTSKASIFRCSALFTVQRSHPYMTTGKTIALTRRTFGWQRSIHVAKNGIILLKYCGERAPPLAKVMRKEAWHTQML